MGTVGFDGSPRGGDIVMSGIDLKILRIKHGVRQYEVAGATGIPAPVLSMFENGRRPLPPARAEAIKGAILRLAKGVGDARA
jgi:transcriptional regulator with XRE-family HTH domain